VALIIDEQRKTKEHLILEDLASEVLRQHNIP